MRKRSGGFPAWAWMAAAVCLLTLCLIKLSARTAFGEGLEVLETSVLRFHVVANSDSAQDQELKLRVRSRILKILEPLVEEAESLEDIKQILSQSIDQIQAGAQEIVEEAGFDCQVRTEIKKCWFPQKQYGGTLFPGGWYDTLRITLGKGKGHNWWCLLFPYGSLEDCVRGIFPKEQKQALENILTEEEYESLFDWEETGFRVKLLAGELFG